jgi:hypothetical protein
VSVEDRFAIVSNENNDDADEKDHGSNSGKDFPLP